MDLEDNGVSSSCHRDRARDKHGNADEREDRDVLRTGRCSKRDDHEREQGKRAGHGVDRLPAEARDKGHQCGEHVSAHAINGPRQGEGGSATAPPRDRNNSDNGKRHK